MDNTQFDDVQITRRDAQLPGEVRKINLDTCGINAKYLNEKRIARIQELGKRLNVNLSQREEISFPLLILLKTGSPLNII